jgi:Putative porin
MKKIIQSNLIKKLTIVTLVSSFFSAPAFAQSAAAPSSALSSTEAVEQLHQTTLAIVEALVAKGILTRDAADGLLSAASAKAKAASSSKQTLVASAEPKAAEPVRVQYVPEIVKREMREQIRAEVLAQAKTERWGEPGALPEWISRVKVEGDVRLRYQTDRFANSNLQPSQYFDSEDITNFAGLTNSTNDVNRFRIRARLGVTAKVADEVTAGIRLSTGSQTGPVSTSSTSADPSNRFGVKIDRAYISYSPLNYLSVDGGRINNPFFTTELIYAPDMGFDGLAVTLKPDFGTTIAPYLTFGAFPVRHSVAGGDKVMRSLQLGTNWRATEKIGVRFAVARHQIPNAASVPLADRFDSAYNASEYESGFRQRGNTLFRINQDPFVNVAPVYGLATNFDVQAITGSVELAQFDPLRITLVGETVVNRAFNEEKVASLVGFNGIKKRNRGSLIRLTAGHRAITDANQWQVSFGVRKLERDAVLDAFTDPDFVLGGTNVKGQTLSFNYGIARNTSMGLRLLSGSTIDPPISNPTAEPLRVKTIQLDLNVRF